VKRPTTIEEFLEGFERSLRLSGRHKQRVLDEARDHLIEARDRGIADGLDPRAAEIAALEAFGDPVVVASRFDAGLLARLSGELDRFDRWHGAHPTAVFTMDLGLATLVVAVSWSPLVALAFLPVWVTSVWIGRQLRHRKEPGYRYRLWGWKQEHPVAYQVATHAGPLLGAAAYLQLERLAGSPLPTAWIFLMVALFPLGWILNAPKPYDSPAAPAD
jgi:HAAS domain-containing protein